MSNIDPNKKVIVVRDKTFETIKNTVNLMVDFIKPTFGPASNKVIVSTTVTRGIFDDGVQIARDYESNDPVENSIISVVRETAIRTNDRVGDGTTGSLIMVQALINEIAKKTKRNCRKIEKEINKGLLEVQEQLKKLAKPITTKEELKKVALISFDDEKIADMIADLYFKLGKDATITIDKSPIMETIVDMSGGININHGYISQYMISNPERMESVIDKPYILITDYRMTETKDILPIMDKMSKAGIKELVIICDNLEGNALATAIVNRMKGVFFTVAVNAPTGCDKKVTLEDIALMTGAKMFTESKGDKLENAEITDLGRANKFICRQDESIIIEPKGNEQEIKKAVEALKVAITNEQVKVQRTKLEQRLGMFTNSIAVIKVGAKTDNEQKSLKYKVEDAIHAVKSAYKNGIVCGAGETLYNIKTSSPILNEALKYPKIQLFDNMGLDIENYSEGQVRNLVTEELGQFMDVGVIDPVDVLLAGVESAVSIVSTLITGVGMIIETDKDLKI